MPIYSYKAKQPNKKQELNSEIEASSAEEVNKLLIKRGLIPTEIKEQGGGSGSKKSLLGFRGRIKAKDKVLFSRQLATLINAGLPLVQSMHTVAEQTQNKALQTVVMRITGDVEGGMSLADAFSKHPDHFSEVYNSLVRAGEVSGTLDETLERLADQQEKDAAITAKVKGAMIYPAIVLAVITLVVVFMLTSVLPQVETLYNDLNRELPAITRFMLVLSRAITKFWWLIIILMIGGIYLLKAYTKTPGGRHWFDALKMKIPIFGKLFSKLYMSRFSRTGQTLMASSVPMLQMMKITEVAVNNVIVAEAIDRASKGVKGGANLSETLKPEPAFLPLVSQMISVGERSGNIDDMMGKVADYYESELDNEVKSISTTIEPILMVVLAVMAGGMVAAILLPVYGLVGESIAL